jgi:thioredoxin-dependent peroxiredoxin
MAPCRVGDPAPDFTLPGWYDGQRRRYRLAEFRGRPLVLAFHPAAGDATWARQLGEYASELPATSGSDIQVWGVTGADVPAAAGFADQYGVKVPLLADPLGAVAHTFGSGAAGTPGPGRAVLVVDGRGVIVWSHPGSRTPRYRSAAEIAAALATLRRRARHGHGSPVPG